MSELPKGWVACTPSDLVNDPKNEIVDGPFGSNLKASEYTDEGTPIVRIQNVKRMAFLNKNIKYVTDEKAEFLKRHSFKSGDLLITKLGEPLGLTCIAPEYLDEGIIVADIVRLRPNPEVNRKCLAYLLNSEGVIKQINTHTKGSTRARINLSVVRNLNISFPPLAEQKRIVEKLDEVLAQVDTIKARLDGIPALLKRFRQSVLASAVSGKLTEEWRGKSGNVESMKAYLELLNIQREGEYQVACQEAKTAGNRKPRKPSCIDPKVFANSEWIEEFVPQLPENWAVTCIGSIGQNNADSIVDGPFGASINVKNDYIESGTPVIRINNINPFKFDNDNLKFISQEKFSDLKRHNVEGGDLLLGKVGTIGNACIYPFGSEEAMLSTTGSTRIRVDTRVCLREYAELYLNSQKVAFNNIASAAVQPFLNMKTIKSFPFIAPPISEQKEIVRLVDQYFAFADTIEAQVKKVQARVDNLTQSILAKAFRGELVAQDPNDEPADKLLERIAQARKEAEALAKAAKKAQSTKSTAKKKVAKSA
ncbi:restriction endonuclease subunit S [Vibrio harveyi]|uniref:restriction endonuclease subunit S n=1 Tax=Vibrio harveyi TaxID=669 RepID=UPI00126354FF|nr:restriction endonuclease subunit S [Vibrio harveyi]QFQ80813.1 type I restriction endonuclease subunit S [Vibrio harveyi]